MRALRFTIALVLAVVAGVAGASAVIGQTNPAGDAGPQDIAPDGTGAAIAATAPDPEAVSARSAGAGTPAPWAVRVYRSQAGLACPEPGRSRDGDFGRVDHDGTFTPLALEASGSCVDLTKDKYSIGVAHFPADDQRGARAVVFGVVAPDVRSVALTRDGTRDALDIANGAYVAVLEDADAGGSQVAVTLADGTTRTVTLQPSTLAADGAQP